MPFISLFKYWSFCTLNLLPLFSLMITFSLPAASTVLNLTLVQYVIFILHVISQTVVCHMRNSCVNTKVVNIGCCCSYVQRNIRYWNYCPRAAWPPHQRWSHRKYLMSMHSLFSIFHTGKGKTWKIRKETCWTYASLICMTWFYQEPLLSYCSSDLSELLC